MRRIVAYWLLAVAIVSGAGAGTIAYARRPPDYASLQREGGRIVEQIEAYKAVHGEYPVDAQTAGIELPMTKYAQWEYQRFGSVGVDEGTGAQWYWVRLSTKVPVEVMRPYFTLGWSSQRPGWRISTDSC